MLRSLLDRRGLRGFDDARRWRSSLALLAAQPAVGVDGPVRWVGVGEVGLDGAVRAVVQRVSRASVVVDDEVVGAIEEPGLLVYVGVTHDDGLEDVAWLARKVRELRLLWDEQSVAELGAPVLVVSQFTLYGDARKGRRPSWHAAAPGPVSEPLYRAFCERLEQLGTRVERGIFGADMAVSSVNDGPVTLVLESP